MTMVFLNFSKKIPKYSIFGLEFRHFQVFANFTIWQIWGSSSKYDNDFLKFYPKNTQSGILG